MNRIKSILVKIINLLRYILLTIFYYPVFIIFFHNNIWRIYRSYSATPRIWKKIIWNRYMEKHAASISIDAKIKSPLILPHGVSGIFITQSAVIGSNVVIFQQVTIGANTIEGSKSYGAPVVGDNVYIGAGAKIIGGIQIANNCRVGANAVVVEDIPYNSIVVLDKPRVIIREQPIDNTFNPYLKKQE